VNETKAPPSHQATDLFVLLFAAWTLLVNGVVLGHGGLARLLGLLPWAGLGVAALLVWWYRGRPDPAPDGPLAETPRDLGWRARVVFAAALGIALAIPACGRETMQWLGMDPISVTTERLLGWATVTFVLLLGWLWLMRRGGAEDRRPHGGARAELLLWLLAAVVAFLAYGFHVNDYDDALYVNFSVAALDDPAQPLLSYDTLHGVPDMPVMFPFYKSSSVEVLAAALAKATGWSALKTFHVVFPPLFCLLGTLAFARLLKVLCPSRWLWCTVLAMLLFFLGGPARRSYELLFWQAHEGKSAYVILMTPLILLHALRFAERPGLRRWILLFGALVCGAGLTGTALWTGPATAGLGLVAGMRPSLRGVRDVALGLLAASWLVLLTWLFHEERPIRLASSSMEAVVATVSDLQDGTKVLRYNLQLVFGHKERLLLGLAVMCMTWLLCPGPRGRRLALAIPLGLLVCQFNPWVGRLMVRRVVGHQTFVRIFWCLPSPAFLAVVLAAPTLLPWRGRTWILGLLASVALTFAYATTVPRHDLDVVGDTDRGAGEKTFAPRWDLSPERVPEQALGLARLLNASVPPKSMVLAPLEVSVWVPTLEGYSYPVVCRSYYFPFLQERYLSAAERAKRVRLQNAVSDVDEQGSGTEVLRRGIRDLDIAGLVLKHRGPELAPNMKRMLQDLGFRLVGELGPYQVWAETGLD